MSLATTKAVDAVREIADREAATVTADTGCAYAKVYGGLERRGIDPLIPARKDFRIPADSDPPASRNPGGPDARGRAPQLQSSTSPWLGGGTAALVSGCVEPVE